MIRATDMLITISARLGGKVINFAVFLVLARALTVEELGWLGFVYTTAFFLTAAFDVGIRNSVAYYIGKSPDDLGVFTSLVYALWAPLATLALLVLYFILHVASSDIVRAEYFVPSALFVASMLFMRMGQGVLLGQGRIAFFNQTELSARVALAIATLSLLALGKLSLSGALWAYATSQLVSSLVLARGTARQAARLTKSGLRLGWVLIQRGFIFMLGVLLMIAAKRVTVMLLSQVGTGEELGLFYGLDRFTEILTQAANAVAVVVFSQNVRSSTRAEAVGAAAQSTRLSLMVFAIVALVMMISADILVPIAMGGKYAGETALFRVLLIGTMAASIWTILFPSMSAIVSPRTPIVLFLPSVFVNVGLSWLCYRWWGIVGVGWAFAISSAALSATFLIAFRVMFSVPVRAFLVPSKSELLALFTRITSRLWPNRAAKSGTPGAASTRVDL